MEFQLLKIFKIANFCPSFISGYTKLYFNHLVFCNKNFLFRNNNITDLDEIYYLKDLKNLKILWLADNDCALNLNDSNYRQTVLR